MTLIAYTKQSSRTSFSCRKKEGIDKDSVRDATNNACRCGFKKTKVQILKSDFENFCMKECESVDDFAMKLTIIITDIHSLDKKVEEISIVKNL